MKSYEELRSAGYDHEFARAYVEAAERTAAGLDRSPVVPPRPAPAPVESRSYGDPDADTPAGLGHGTGLVMPGGLPPTPPVDTDERRAAHRALTTAHGWTDPWGVPTHAYLERVQVAEDYQRNLHGRGRLWVGNGRDDTEVREFISRMRSGVVAQQAMIAAGYGPADVAAHVAEAQRRAAELSGVESWTPPDALERTAEAMHGTVWQGVHHEPPRFDAERGA